MSQYTQNKSVPDIETQKQTAYLAGFKAWGDGKGMRNNPHPTASLLFEAWHNGWMQADREWYAGWMQANKMDWNKLSDYLKTRSAEICRDNGCTEDDHNCESYAYITRDRLLDICSPDYFQGSSKPYAAVSLPWCGTGEELQAEVGDQCAEMQS